MLREKYTLDSFVVGNNKLLFNAVKEVIKNPGKAYSPLFIYGGTGEGKTHLLHAMENEIMKNYSELHVEYMTIEKIVTEVKLLMQENKFEQFKNQMRNIDVLLLDDFQFISGKERIQEVLSEIICEMISSNKQVVIASEVVLEELDIFSEKFKDCFGRGLKVEILKGDFCSRLEILKRKCEEKKYQIDEEYLCYIAKNFEKNNGALIGVLNRMIAFTDSTELPMFIDNGLIDKIEGIK